MADLQKVIKLTQAQYDTLAAGGTVGSYTGLNDNYIYLVEDNSQYLPLISINSTTTVNDLPTSCKIQGIDGGYFCYKVPGVNNNVGLTCINSSGYYYKFGKIDSTLVEDILVDANYHEYALVENLATVATTGSYNDLSDKPTIPTVNNGTLSIQGNGTTASTFTANQSGNTTLNIKGSGGTTVTKSANNEITISTGTIPADTNQTIKGNGTAFGSNDAINIVGAGTVTVTADTTNKKITITGSAHTTDHNQTVKGNGTAFGADDAINIVGSGATTVTADTTNKKITINTPSVTDTNQKVKAGSVTFGNNDEVDIVAGSNVTVTGLASGTGAPKITISATNTGATSIETTGSGNAVSSASYDSSTRKITLTKGVTALTSHQSIKTLKTDNTTAQTASSSEAIAGSGTINLHKVAKTGTYSDLIGTPTIPTSFNLTDDILDGSANKYAPYTSKGAGHLYTGTTAPSSTNRLNYDGYFYATKLYSGGNEVLTSFTESDTLATVTGRGATTSTAVTMSGGVDVTGNNLKLNKISAPTSSGGTTYGTGSSGQVLKSNGSTVYWASDNNNYVTQSQITTNANYPLLLAGNNTSTTSSQTTSVNKNYSNLYANPSTGRLHASSFDLPYNRNLFSTDIFFPLDPNTSASYTATSSASAIIDYYWSVTYESSSSSTNTVVMTGNGITIGPITSINYKLFGNAPTPAKAAKLMCLTINVDGTLYSTTFTLSTTTGWTGFANIGSSGFQYGYNSSSSNPYFRIRNNNTSAKTLYWVKLEYGSSYTTYAQYSVTEILSNLYPVGSVYLAYNTTNSPALRFGGSWAFVGTGYIVMEDGNGRTALEVRTGASRHAGNANTLMFDFISGSSTSACTSTGAVYNALTSNGVSLTISKLDGQSWSSNYAGMGSAIPNNLYAHIGVPMTVYVWYRTA